MRVRARVSSGSSGPSLVSTWGKRLRAQSKSSLSINPNNRDKGLATDSSLGLATISSSSTRLESMPNERDGVVALLPLDSRISSRFSSPMTCGE